MMQRKVSKRGFIAGLLSTVAMAAQSEGLEQSLRPRLRPPVVPQRPMGEIDRLVEAAKLSGDEKLSMPPVQPFLSAPHAQDL